MKSPVTWARILSALSRSSEGQSDTATFEPTPSNARHGRLPAAHAAMMMIPEAGEQHPLMDERRRVFYEYHAAMMELQTAPPPWFHPTAVRCAVNRNGLRPARCYQTPDDDLVVLASESGAAHPRKQDRQEVGVCSPAEFRLTWSKAASLTRRAGRTSTPTRALSSVDENRCVKLDDIVPATPAPAFAANLLDCHQQAFGVTQEVNT